MGAVFLSRVPVNMLIRDGKYHYRRRIPAALVDFFGKKEVTKSLNTENIRQASRLNSYIDGQVEKLFHACRFNSLTQDVAKAHLEAILNGGSPPEPQDNQSAATITIATPTQRKGKRLSDAIEALCKEKEHGWTTKTKKEYTGIYKQLLKGLADPRLKDLARPTLVEYRETLKHEDKSDKTVNKYLGILSNVLRHAGRLKWIQGNPAEGLGIKDKRRPDEVRRIFTTDEISIIFKALQRDKQSFYDKGRHERYWLPLLGLFTGARVNEVAQLDINDIGTEEGIPVIFIRATSDDDKRLGSTPNLRTLQRSL